MNCAVCNKPVYDNFANGLCGNCLQDWKAQNLYQKKSVAQPIIDGMDINKNHPNPILSLTQLMNQHRE